MNIEGVKTLEKSKIQSFRIELDPKHTNGHDFVELLINEKHNSFTARLYGGEVYTHSWGAPGDDFIKFLIRTFTDSHYLFAKLANDSLSDFIDTDKTTLNMMEKIISKRRAHICTEEEARNAWEFAEKLNDYTLLSKEQFYMVYSIEGTGDIFEEDYWYEDSIAYKEDRKARVFCNLVAPILSKVVEYEYGPRYTSYGGRTTKMEELPVGTRFHVCNGVWDGTIVEVDNVKKIRIGKDTFLPIESNPELDIIIKGENDK